MQEHTHTHTWNKKQTRSTHKKNCIIHIRGVYTVFYVALHFMANLSIHMLKFTIRTKYAPTNRHFMQTDTILYLSNTQSMHISSEFVVKTQRKKKLCLSFRFFVFVHFCSHKVISGR